MSKQIYLLLWFALIPIILFCCKKDGDSEPRIISETGCQDPLSNDYVLPFPVGSSYSLIQGRCGSRDHVQNTRYAYDFQMDIGSIITAAQDGSVLFVEEGYTDNDHERGHENAVIIEHENGTYGRYLHLTHDGVLVEVGEEVLRGDTIALSGFSGFTPGPNLHFDVINCQSCADQETVSIGFFNSDPFWDNRLQVYTAIDY